MAAKRPNVLITGTPGTGKTSTSEMVAQQTGLRHINVGEWVKEKGLHSGWNNEFQCFDLDEDKVNKGASGPGLTVSCWFRRRNGAAQEAPLLVPFCPHHVQVCDALEELMTEGGNVVDHHGCDFFPERCAALSKHGLGFTDTPSASFRLPDAAFLEARTCHMSDRHWCRGMMVVRHACADGTHDRAELRACAQALSEGGVEGGREPSALEWMDWAGLAVSVADQQASAPCSAVHATPAPGGAPALPGSGRHWECWNARAAGGLTWSWSCKLTTRCCTTDWKSGELRGAWNAIRCTAHGVACRSCRTSFVYTLRQAGCGTEAAGCGTCMWSWVRAACTYACWPCCCRAKPVCVCACLAQRLR